MSARREAYLVSRIASGYRTEPAIVREALARCGIPIQGDVCWLPAGNTFPKWLLSEILDVAQERQRCVARTGRAYPQ